MLRIALLSLIVALGLLAAGYMLIPRGAERALISLRDQDVDEAVTQYEAQYAEGDRSIGTLSALARIYEAQGRIAAAVRIAGELSFAYADPNRALQRQADIYRAGQEFGRAIEVLEEIPLDRRSEDELRWLVGQERSRIAAWRRRCATRDAWAPPTDDPTSRASSQASRARSIWPTA